MAVEVTSRRVEVIQAKDEAVAKALEIIGQAAERYAKELCPVDTGNLRNSISHEVDDTTVYVGTNTEYAPYVEFGTGIYAEGGGRPTPWRYQDDKGEWHTTSGMQPQPFLGPSIDNHIQEYKQFLENELKGQ